MTSGKTTELRTGCFQNASVTTAPTRSIPGSDDKLCMSSPMENLLFFFFDFQTSGGTRGVHAVK